MRKYGVENFVMHHVEFYDTPAAAKAGEVEWIAYLRMMRVKLYNETDGGDGTSGRKNSPETIARMKAAHKGKVISPEQRAQISKTLKIRFADPTAFKPETRAKISASLKGKPKPLRTPEQCKHYSEAARARGGHPHTIEAREKMRQSAYAREERKKLGLPSFKELRDRKRALKRLALDLRETTLGDDASVGELQLVRTSADAPPILLDVKEK